MPFYLLHFGDQAGLEILVLPPPSPRAGMKVWCHQAWLNGCLKASQSPYLHHHVPTPPLTISLASYSSMMFSAEYVKANPGRYIIPSTVYVPPSPFPVVQGIKARASRPAQNHVSISFVHLFKTTSLISGFGSSSAQGQVLKEFLDSAQTSTNVCLISGWRTQI